MRYEEPQPTGRDTLESAVAADDTEQICEALISAAFYEPDWRWIQGQCLALLTHHSIAVRSAAVISLGHIARIHRQIDREIVIPALEALRGDTQLLGSVDNALEDIDIFANTSSGE
jgi:hypothetical protein